MCMMGAPKAKPLPAVPLPLDEPVAPMVNPEDIDGATTGALRKSKSRQSLKIDLAGTSGSTPGLNIPL